MEQFKVFITRSARKYMCVCAKKRDSCNTQPPPPLPFFSPYLYGLLVYKIFIIFFSQKSSTSSSGLPFSCIHIRCLSLRALSQIIAKGERERESERTGAGAGGQISFSYFFFLSPFPHFYIPFFPPSFSFFFFASFSGPRLPKPPKTENSVDPLEAK